MRMAGRAAAFTFSGKRFLRRIAGDTFAFENHRLVLTPTAARLDTATLVRRIFAAGTFRITPLRPVEELRREALAARPPSQPATLRAPDLVELKALDPTIKYDIRYATTNNFMGAVF